MRKSVHYCPWAKTWAPCISLFVGSTGSYRGPCSGSIGHRASHPHRGTSLPGQLDAQIRESCFRHSCSSTVPKPDHFGQMRITANLNRSPPSTPPPSRA
ncbi:hypothetical protein P4O66_007933 [Electrophorus voltai]|uniref:Uncharacterized protein n=1 Tax=Electrophorus voltai TaxID=2609070 RepID=A0AAD9DYK2_9TELE|nr:hypothetical protein P4O66_007933 [Electrophorus voltai]